MSLEQTLRRVRQKAGERVQAHAQELQDDVVELHATAPRGGENVNTFGQYRSALGEAPAVEFGDLLSALQEPVQYNASTLTASTIVNYKILEYGTRNTQSRQLIAPRPMGRIALDNLKRRRAQ